jgi:tRNA(fMet)-specific endonuclease VapC
MIGFVFSTRILLSLIQRADSQVARRLKALPPRQRGVTVITLEEQMRGRLAQIAQAKSGDQFLRAYHLLELTHHGLCKIQRFAFDENAQRHFDELKRRKIRIGTLDLRIAAIALARKAVLVTRNRRDFAKIPNLEIEDWSLSEESVQ